MSVTVDFFLDTRRVKKNGKYPVKLQLICKRKVYRYQTIYELEEQEYKGLFTTRAPEHLKSVRDVLKECLRKAEDTLQKMTPFSPEEFETCFILNNTLFHQRKGIIKASELQPVTFQESHYASRFPIFKLPKPEPGTVLETVLFYISKLLSEHRIRTAGSYQTMYTAFSKFRGNVKLTDITVTFLKQFEIWMLERDYSRTTVGIYSRTLRTIFNEAIFQGIIQREKHYPFGRRKYQPPASRNTKKALPLEDVSKLYYYEPEYERERKARDFWMFSYFANGINPTDIANLKWKNIEEEYLVFDRAKTENTSRTDPRSITIFITEDMWRIIDYWGNKDRSANNYIFPVLQPGITPLRKVELIELFVQSINDWLRRIREKLGIQKKVTTYVARHTFSTIMKRSGASTEFIQEALGHTNIKTTESYLDSFEKRVKKDYAEKLLSFKEILRDQD